jgi:hypothetical protein
MLKIKYIGVDNSFVVKEYNSVEEAYAAGSEIVVACERADSAFEYNTISKSGKHECYKFDSWEMNIKGVAGNDYKSPLFEAIDQFGKRYELRTKQIMRSSGKYYGNYREQTVGIAYKLFKEIAKYNSVNEYNLDIKIQRMEYRICDLEKSLKK